LRDIVEVRGKIAHVEKKFAKEIQEKESRSLKIRSKFKKYLSRP